MFEEIKLKSKYSISKFIEGTSDNYNSADRKQYRSLCSIVAILYTFCDPELVSGSKNNVKEPETSSG